MNCVTVPSYFCCLAVVEFCVMSNKSLVELNERCLGDGKPSYFLKNKLFSNYFPGTRNTGQIILKAFSVTPSLGNIAGFQDQTLTTFSFNPGVKLNKKMEELTSQHGIENHVIFTVGEGGLTKVQLRLTAGAKAELFLHGAHVTSFVNEQGHELIFMSSQSNYDRLKAIRGGIPVIFPQFGPGELPQHGFARTALWTVKETTVADGGNEVAIVLELRGSEATKAIWPHDFVFTIKNTISYSESEKSKFSQQLEVKNIDSQPFKFTTALHTYFKIQDVRKTHVVGLQNVPYYDKVAKALKTQEQESVSFEGATDSVYHSTPNEVWIAEEGSSSKIQIEKTNLPDMVIWNCWNAGANAMADMGDNDWIHYVCCETAWVQNPVILHSGETWKAGQAFRLTSGDSSKY